MRVKLFFELSSIASTSSTIIGNTKTEKKNCPNTLINNGCFEFGNISIFNNNLKIKKSQKNSTLKKLFECRNLTKIRSNSLILGFIILVSLFSLIYCEAKINAFIIEPNVEPYYVKERDVGPLINCVIADKFKNRSHYELEWMKIVNGFPITVSRNSELYDRKSYDLEENIKDGEYNLRIKFVNFKHDNGNFFCKLIDLEDRQHQHVSKPAQIIVVVSPEPPQIILEPKEFVYENQLISIDCASTGGNPAPKFLWIFDNDTRVPDAWSQKRQEIETGRTISTLKWHVKSEDNGAYLTCQIWNEAMHEAEVLSIETNRLNVHYAPRVSAGPLSQLNVEAGQPIELNCKADSNPKILKFEWKHIGSGKIHPDIKWNFIAERHFNGEFRCSASNSINTGSAKLDLNVLFGPQIRIKRLENEEVKDSDLSFKTFEPPEGDQLILECEVEANPAADRIWWTEPNGSFIQNGSRLIISNVQKSNIGNFTCFSSNTLKNLYSPFLNVIPTVIMFDSKPEIRISQSSVFVNVKRRPGAAFIAVDNNVLEVGQRVVLTCTTDDYGNPPAKFRWETPNSLSSSKNSAKNFANSRELIIEEAKLEDNGRYKCIPYNSFGQGKDSQVKILVIQPSQITRPLKQKILFTAGDTDMALHCEAQGYPQPKFEWFKDGTLIDNSGLVSRLRTHYMIKNHKTKSDCEKEDICLHTIISSLHFFDTVQWLDKGNYTCRTYNGAHVQNFALTSENEGIYFSSTQVTVVHEPKILNEKFPDYALAAANIGETARIVCHVSARPEPTIIWLRDGREIITDNQPHYRAHASRYFNKLDEFESILELKDVTESDYGSYNCIARNGASSQKATIEIKLQEKSRPQTPKHTRLLKSGINWLLIGWKAGFDGGDSQEFEVEYRIIDSYGHSSIDFDNEESANIFIFNHNNATLMTFYDLDNEDADTTTIVSAITMRKRRQSFSSTVKNPETFFVHNLTHLRPMTALFFRVRSRNVNGISDWSKITRVITLDTLETDIIIAPESVKYFFDEKKLIIQQFKSSIGSLIPLTNVNKFSKENPNKKNGSARELCTLVYVSSLDSKEWRSIDCFNQTPITFTTKSHTLLDNAIVIYDIKPAERYKVRFCLKNDLTVCSTPAEIHVDISAMAITPSWEILLFVAFCTIVFIIFIILILYCCRRFLFAKKFSTSSTVSTTSSTNKKNIEKCLNGIVINKNEIDASLPKVTVQKNTIIHGSQNDSGVFTLASSTNTAIQNGVGLNLNASSNGENWRQQSSSNHSSSGHSPYFGTDSYLQEFNQIHRIVAIENGLAADELIDSQQNYASIFKPQRNNHLQDRRASLLSNNIQNMMHINGAPSVVHSDPEENGITGAAILVGMGDTSAVNSNEKLIVTTAESSDSASYSGAGSNVSCRVMREIIV